MKYRYEEKLKMDRKEEIKARLAKQLPTRVFSYIHNQGRIGVLLEIQSDTDFALRNDLVEAFAHEVCLQIASMNPVALSTAQGISNLDPRELAKVSFVCEARDKPESVRDKIVAGKMDKWDKENVLLEQPWVKDNNQTISEMLASLCKVMGEDVRIVQFARFGS